MSILLPDYLKTTEGDILIIQFGSGKFTDG
jgi:hypothetical protein